MMVYFFFFPFVFPENLSEFVKLLLEQDLAMQCLVMGYLNII